MSPRYVDKERKREAILRAAMRVFADRSVYDFKMIDIARAAVVGKGTLYEYFSSKEDLVAGCMGLFVSDYEHHVSGRIEAVSGSGAKIRAFVDASVSFFAGEPHRVQLIFDFWSVTVRAFGREALEDHGLGSFMEARRQLEGVISAGIQRGEFRQVNAQMTASMLLALLDGLLFQAAMGIVRLDRPDAAQQISDTFLEGIQA